MPEPASQSVDVLLIRWPFKSTSSLQIRGYTRYMRLTKRRSEKLGSPGLSSSLGVSVTGNPNDEMR